MSGIADKVKNTLSGSNTTSTTGEGTHFGSGNDHTTPRTNEPAYNTRSTATSGGLTGDNYTAVGGNTGPAPKTDGPHKSDLLNKADPRIDSDRDYSKNMGLNPQGNASTGKDNITRDTGAPLGSATGTTTGQGLHGSQHTTTHSSGLTGSSTTTGAREGDFGPHSSRAANAADPRVDSDLDGSRRTGGTTGTTGFGSGTTHGTSGLTGSTGTTGTTGFGSATTHGTTTHSTSHVGGSGVREGEFGPHSSRAANAADPRVDSDLDSSRRTGGTTGTTGFGSGTTHESSTLGSSTLGSGAHNTHSTTTGSGLTGSTGTHGTTHSSTLGSGNTHSHSTTTGSSGLREGEVGPHSSRAANAADPRVDSDLDGSRNKHSTTTGATGTTGHSTSTTGHSNSTTGHSTSTTGHSATTTGTAATTGPAPNTAGPHKSDLLNKLDPRVDSNLDGSKTVGGNKTFEGSSK